MKRIKYIYRNYIKPIDPLHYFSLLAILLVVTSCVVKNDMDYPLVIGNITKFEVEGQKSSDINSTRRTVTVDLTEKADIRNLKLKSFAVSKGVTIDNPPTEIIDLSKPMTLKLKTYQEYNWTIEAVQKINRYINCEGQVGKASFDEKNHTAVVLLAAKQKLEKVHIKDMKLEAEGSEVIKTVAMEPVDDKLTQITRECAFPMVLNCVFERDFIVKTRETEVKWTIKFICADTSAEITKVTPWAHSAKILGFFSGNGTPEMQYKEPSESQWNEVKLVKTSGVDVSAVLSGLKDGTTYIARIKDEDTFSPEFTFKTDKAAQLYNMNFDDWHLDGKVWYPYLADCKDDHKIWDSANKATASFIGSTTTPEDKILAVEGPGKHAAKLESTFAVVKFAAGNLVTGKFVALKGLGAELAWGIPFDSKPVSLHGYFNYKPAVINHADDEHKHLLDKSDIGQIRVFLTDWPSPFHVISSDKKFVDYERDPHIIADGEMLTDEDSNGYKEFTIPLEYRDIRTPKYVVIVCASSRYGDYFTGGEGSVLYVDEFEFIYK